MFLLKHIKQFFGRTIYRYVLGLSGIALLLFVLNKLGLATDPLIVILSCLLIVLSSIVIWRAGDHFSPAAGYIEDHHDIPQSIKAAVIDAVASSFPEFAVAVIAVFLIGKAEVGVATIIGSALYNILVIPAAVGLVAVTPVLVSREVVWRDNMFYIFTVILLVGVLWLFPHEWGLGVATVFLVAYIGYVLLLQHHYRSHKKQVSLQEKSEEVSSEEDDQEEIIEVTSEKEAWLWIVGMMLLMGGSAHVLVEASITLGKIIGVSEVVMAFVVIAAGTSVPDMVLSILSAKRGNYDAAVSNVFGSNIFDICICLSIPIMLAFVLSGHNTKIDMPQIELVWGLLAATLIAFFCFWSNHYTLTKVKASLLGLLYVVLIVYALVLV